METHLDLLNDAHLADVKVSQRASLKALHLAIMMAFLMDPYWERHWALLSDAHLAPQKASQMATLKVIL